MAKVALKYRSAIDEITANKSLKLRKFELDDDDWKIIRDLLRVLKVGSSFFNSSQILIVHVRYIKMQHFFSRKTKFQQSQMLFRLWTTLTRCSVASSSSVKHALTFARKSINKYYSKTDLSNVYRIAMGMFKIILWPLHLNLIHRLTLVLHPQLKLKYFQQRGWTHDWISTAEAIVREEFVKYETPSATTPILVRPVSATTSHTAYLPPHNHRRRHLWTTWTLRRTSSTSP